MRTFRHIAVATDLSSCGARAVDLAARMANDESSALSLIHVFEVPVWSYDAAPFSPVDLLGPMIASAEQRLVEELGRVRIKVPQTESIFRRGSAIEEVLLAVDEVRADLLVVGTHGRRGLQRVVMGSVAEQLVRLSPVPVLVMRGT